MGNRDRILSRINGGVQFCMGKKYKRPDGGYDDFDCRGFRNYMDKAIKKRLFKSLNEEMRYIAEKLHVDFDTVKKWKQGKNSPNNPEMLEDLACILGCKKEDLLEPVLEKKTKSNADMRVTFNGIVSPFSLAIDGYTNLLDYIIGGCSAEEGCLNLMEKIYDFYGYDDDMSFEKILGYEFNVDSEEYANAPSDKRADIIRRGFKNSNGDFLYNEEGVMTIRGLQLFEAMLENPIVKEDEDYDYFKGLIKQIKEQFVNYNPMSTPYALLTVHIQNDGKHFCDYQFGLSDGNPSYENVEEIFTKLLEIFDGKVEKLAFCNAKEIKMDQFEYEAEFTFDLLA